VDGATIDVTVSAQDSGILAPAASDATKTTVTVTSATLTVSKDVSTDGSTWGAANAAPGATLYYRITVTNPSATTNANNVVISDPQPQFTTYDGGSAKANTTAGVTYADAGNAVLTDANAVDDGYDFNVTTGNTATYSVGNLTPGASVVLFFTVTVN
jgi:fimbrial isopeptide formation D2 family protein